MIGFSVVLDRAPLFGSFLLVRSLRDRKARSTRDTGCFLDLARRSHASILMIYGAQTPSRSPAEMEALTIVPRVQSVCLPLGKLSVHEEFPNLVAEAIETFLADRTEPTTA